MLCMYNYSPSRFISTLKHSSPILLGEVSNKSLDSLKLYKTSLSNFIIWGYVNYILYNLFELYLLHIYIIFNQFYSYLYFSL